MEMAVCVDGRTYDTVEGEGGAGDDAGLEDDVLLPGEGLGGDAEAGQQPRPRLDHEEAEEARHDVERRADAGRQPDPHRHEAQHGAQHRTHILDQLLELVHAN